jgi:acyl-CoA synthetase (AMP-forming)/AMP-acid ligase II
VLQQVIQAGTTRHPDKPLVISPTRTVSWGETAARAEEFAAGLRARGITRFGCVLDDIGELLALLSGSAAAGAEACMYPCSTTEDSAAELARQFDHNVVITDRALGLPEELAASALAIHPNGDDTADSATSPLLILTTGTTGEPKGARHDWARLVASHQRRVGDHDARWLLAHVPNQFAGLGVVLHCLVSGATLVVPRAYQPRDAVEAIRAHGVTHISTTPTFWRFLLGLLGDDTADLPLVQITLAGEAVPSALLDDLHRTFPNARISQIYGATEFGSSVAVGDTRNGLPAAVLERGDDADVQFRIVDGELQVRSRIGMLGYYGSDDVGESWRPTGDLVELRGDRIQFVGRNSETINVGGVKVHPLPIEEAITGVAGVALAHVHGRSNPMTGEIVAVDVVAAPGVDTEQLEDTIREACAHLPAAAQPRRIRFVDTLDVRDTKIARR